MALFVMAYHGLCIYYDQAVVCCCGCYVSRQLCTRLGGWASNQGLTADEW